MNDSMHAHTHAHTHTHTHTHTSSPAKPNTILLAAALFQQLNNVKLVIIVLNIGLWVAHIQQYNINHQINNFKNTHIYICNIHNYIYISYKTIVYIRPSLVYCFACINIDELDYLMCTGNIL